MQFLFLLLFALTSALNYLDDFRHKPKLMNLLSSSQSEMEKMKKLKIL